MELVLQENEIWKNLVSVFCECVTHTFNLKFPFYYDSMMSSLFTCRVWFEINLCYPTATCHIEYKLLQDNCTGHLLISISRINYFCHIVTLFCKHPALNFKTLMVMFWTKFCTKALLTEHVWLLYFQEKSVPLHKNYVYRHTFVSSRRMRRNCRKLGIEEQWWK